MTGRLYIDGHDAYTEFGMYIEAGGWNELLSMPPLKTLRYNDWHEEDGIEPDLAAPVLDSRELTVRFACNDTYNRFVGFRELIADGAYHIFNSPAIQRAFRLRYLSENYSEENGLLKISIRFADDFPIGTDWRNYRYQTPSSDMPRQYGYKLDDWYFSDFGIRVLSGTLQSVKKYPNAKLNLVRNITTQSGADYDAQTVTFASKDITINCLMTSPLISGLWRNYDSFLYNLILPDARVLYVEELEQEFQCIYKSSQVSEFFPDAGKLWLRFSLVLTIIGSNKITDADIVLASENSEVVYTEDNMDAIDMQPI